MLYIVRAETKLVEAAAVTDGKEWDNETTYVPNGPDWGRKFYKRRVL